MAASQGAGAHAKGNSVIINGKKFPVYSYDFIRSNYFGYVYVTINKLNNMKYIGIAYKKRGSRNYLGSGTYFKNAVKHYGRNNFHKYIIDYSYDRVSLEELEVDYIRNRFGENCAKSSSWYNITDGLQRGGNHWIGLSDKKKSELIALHKESLAKWRMNNVEETKRLAQQSSAFMTTYFSNPKNREKTSIATKKAMARPEIKEKLHKPRIITKPRLKISDSARKHMATAQKKRFQTETVWNKDKHMTKAQRQSLVYSQSSVYKITIDAISFTIRTRSVIQLTAFLQSKCHLDIGRNTVGKYINDGKKHKIPSHELTISKIHLPVNENLINLNIIASEKYNKLQGRHYNGK